MKAEREPIVGGYLNLEVRGRNHRIYYETAGEGQPLLCLHTAGSDTRQFRSLMNAREVTQNHRVVCFDLPYHGKSSPPEGWQKFEYRLSSDLYVETIMAVVDALELTRPIVMGCSIGGRVVLHLALRHPERFAAFIGLQSGAHVDPYYDLAWLHRPDVHGGEVCAGIISGLVGPAANDLDRWETIWHYMQSGPGIHKGDLYFYKAEGDVRGVTGQIDTRRCPLYLLTGEYDYSCTPDDSRALADSVPGSRLQIMEGIGHFPMSEAPGRFLGYLQPILDEIRSQASSGFA